MPDDQDVWATLAFIQSQWREKAGRSFPAAERSPIRAKAAFNEVEAAACGSLTEAGGVLFPPHEQSKTAL
jgi:hypothetical protein